METGTVLRKVRRARGLTQARLARKLELNESTLRNYELGLKRVPHEVADRAAHGLTSPELCFAQCGDCPANRLLSYPWKADLHPSTQLLNLLEECPEAIEAVQALELRNARTLDGAQQQAVEQAVDQVLDLVTGTAAFAASMAHNYGIDIRAAHRRHRQKLEARGHTCGPDEEVDVA